MPRQAVIDAAEMLYHGHPEVVDADLADYFGSIPHAELMRSLVRRVVDSRVLHLIKMWLECAVEVTDDRGRNGSRRFVAAASTSRAEDSTTAEPPRVPWRTDSKLMAAIIVGLKIAPRRAQSSCTSTMTSRLMIVLFVGVESTFSYFEATRQYIDRYGSL